MLLYCVNPLQDFFSKMRKDARKIMAMMEMTAMTMEPRTQMETQSVDCCPGYKLKQLHVHRLALMLTHPILDLSLILIPWPLSDHCQTLDPSPILRSSSGFVVCITFASDSHFLPYSNKPRCSFQWISCSSSYPNKPFPRTSCGFTGRSFCSSKPHSSDLWILPCKWTFGPWEEFGKEGPRNGEEDYNKKGKEEDHDTKFGWRTGCWILGSSSL